MHDSQDPGGEATELNDIKSFFFSTEAEHQQFYTNQTTADIETNKWV